MLPSNSTHESLKLKDSDYIEIEKDELKIKKLTESNLRDSFKKKVLFHCTKI